MFTNLDVLRYPMIIASFAVLDNEVIMVCGTTHCDRYCRQNYQEDYIELYLDSTDL